MPRLRHDHPSIPSGHKAHPWSKLGLGTRTFSRSTFAPTKKPPVAGRLKFSLPAFAGKLRRERDRSLASDAENGDRLTLREAVRIGFGGHQIERFDVAR